MFEEIYFPKINLPIPSLPDIGDLFGIFNPSGVPRSNDSAKPVPQVTPSDVYAKAAVSTAGVASGLAKSISGLDLSNPLGGVGQEAKKTLMTLAIIAAIAYVAGKAV